MPSHKCFSITLSRVILWYCLLLIPTFLHPALLHFCFAFFLGGGGVGETKIIDFTPYFINVFLLAFFLFVGFIYHRFVLLILTSML